MNTQSTEHKGAHARLNTWEHGLALLNHASPMIRLNQSSLSRAEKLSHRAAMRQSSSKDDRGILRDISVRDLLSLLGLGTCETSSDTEHRLLCEEVRLEAGSSLYEQGQRDEQAFVVLDGVLARQQTSGAKSNALHDPASIALSGEKELIGLHPGVNGRPESATAITKAAALSFSIKAVQSMDSSPTSINDLLMRKAGAALFRDWRVSYRLRDLPAFARTVSGLSYLASLADFKLMMAQAEGIIAMAMPMSILASWLALDKDVLRAQINRLACDGVVSSDANVIHWIAPLKLETLLALM